MQCQWGVGEVGATLNSDQGPNHWKTPTWLQCRLPGQHEQELPTVAAKLQTPSRVAGKPGGAGNFAHSDLTRRAKTKRHAGYILARTKAEASLCDKACQGVVLALANQYPPAPSLRHTHTRANRRNNTQMLLRNFSFKGFYLAKREDTQQTREERRYWFSNGPHTHTFPIALQK